MSYVVEINSIEQLAGYKLLWNALLRQTSGASAFQSYDWLESYWRHFGADQQLRVLIVYVDVDPIGILPLVIRKESTRAGWVRVLTYPLHDWGTFYGPIGPNPTATLLAGIRHVARTARDWDLMDFRWVDADSHDRRRTPTAMRAAGFEPDRQPWAQSGVVRFEGDWEAYWGGRTKKWRHNVRRCERRLQEQGRVTYIRYRPEGEAYGDGDPRWDLFEACVALAEKSWQGASETGTTLSHETIQPFLRDVHQQAAKNGQLDLNLLLVDGRPVAFVYNYHFQGNVYGLRMGYDPDFAAFGPGTVLLRNVLQDSFDRGDSYYDLGIGSLCCKRHWITDLVTSYRYTHYAAHDFQAQLLRMKRWYVRRIYGDNYLGGLKHTALELAPRGRRCDREREKIQRQPDKPSSGVFGQFGRRDRVPQARPSTAARKSQRPPLSLYH